MKLEPSLCEGVEVVARGAATQEDGEPYRRQMLAVVRYADPAAWTTVAAAGQATAQGRAELAAVADRVGMITVSCWGPVETFSNLRSSAASGTVSPLRFPAASPGSLAGLTSIAFGYRGSTLNFTLTPRDGVPLALHIAARWLKQEVLDFVLVAAAAGDVSATASARCLVLGRSRATSPSSLAKEIDWLAAIEQTGQEQS